MTVDLLSMHTHRTIFYPKANVLPGVKEIATIVHQVATSATLGTIARTGATKAFFAITYSAYTIFGTVFMVKSISNISCT